MKKLSCLLPVSVLALTMFCSCAADEPGAVQDKQTASVETVTSQNTEPSNETNESGVTQAPEPTVTPTLAPTITPIPTPEPTPTPIIEPASLDEFRVEELNHSFEGIYWSRIFGETDKTIYFDGTDIVTYSGIDSIEKAPYTVEGNILAFNDTRYEWWYEDDRFLYCREGSNKNRNTYYFIAETEADAIREYPQIALGIPDPDLTLDDLRAETLNYDFEGVYWLSDSGVVYYFDGTNMWSYGFDENGVAEKTKTEYMSTDSTYQYVGADYSFRWYVSSNEFGFWLDGGEWGGDSGGYAESYTAISKENAIKLYPTIGQ